MTTISDVKFDSWLRHTMAERGVSRTDLIHRLSRPGETDQRQNVYKWLDGTRVPRYDKCQAIADALHVPHDDVLMAAGHLHPSEDMHVLPAGHPPITGQMGDGVEPLNDHEIVRLRGMLRIFSEGDINAAKSLFDTLGGLDPAALIRLMRLADALGVMTGGDYPTPPPADLGGLDDAEMAWGRRVVRDALGQ